MEAVEGYCRTSRASAAIGAEQSLTADPVPTVLSSAQCTRTFGAKCISAGVPSPTVFALAWIFHPEATVHHATLDAVGRGV